MANYISLIPGAPLPEDLCQVPPLPAFDAASIAFVEALSARLLRMPQSRVYPELASLGFWMRRANIERLRFNLKKYSDKALLTPRGTVLHFAPSNVDTIFVYSWFLSLLTGNRNIVRLSSKSSSQTDLLVKEIEDLLTDPTYSVIARRTLLVRYVADDQITARLSSVCDVRVIWGGNNTVNQIRKIPISPTTTEVAFANKYSIALVGAPEWLDASESQKNYWIQSFYNDSYWFDQMACSSPRLVLWLGEIECAKHAADDFWNRMEHHLANTIERFDDGDYVNKLVAEDILAIEANVSIRPTSNNDLVRVWLDQPALHENIHCGSGLFFESSLTSLDSLHLILNRSVQTITYAGIKTEKIRDFVSARPLEGIDRIVPFGRALDFDHIWDGFDLMHVFMREITVA